MGETITAAVMMGGGVALAAAAAWLYVADGRARMAKQRVTGVVVAYAPAVATGPSTGLRLLTQSRAALDAQLLSYLRISTDRPDLYPAPWWLVLAVATLVAVLMTGIADMLFDVFVWLLLPVVWFFVVRFTFTFFDKRRTKVLYEQLPDALAMIGRSIRTGITVQDALRVVSEEGQWPTSKEFLRLHDEIRVGSSLSDSLTRLAQRSKLVEYRFFAVALALQSQSGGSLSETLENLADVVRKRVALRQRALALAAEARASMYVLGCLPFVTAAGLMVTSPDYLGVLFTTSLGRHILLAGFVLLGLGFGAMKFIIKKSLS
jgi:tight adherence protein B